MSKLADQIRKAMRLQPQAIGFRTSRTSTNPSMLLVGLAKDGRAAPELVAAGADAVIIGSRDKPANSGAAKEAGDAVVGAWIEASADDEARRYKEAGFDFVVFDPDRAAAAALLEEDFGYVSTLPRDASDTEFRTLEGFQLDAMYTGALERPLTVRRQIELRRLSALTHKPLMAAISANVPPSELQALRDTNVVVVATDTPGNVERLRKLIDALPPRAHRKDEDRPTPLVPRAVGVDTEEHDDGDGD